MGSGISGRSSLPIRGSQRAAARQFNEAAISVSSDVLITSLIKKSHDFKCGTNEGWEANTLISYAGGKGMSRVVSCGVI